jgi:hypothetical protein
VQRNIKLDEEKTTTTTRSVRTTTTRGIIGHFLHLLLRQNGYLSTVCALGSGTVGALAALATSREEQDVRQLFEKFGHVTSFLTKRDVEEQPNQLLDHARGKAGQRRVGQVAFQQRHDVEDFL